MRWGRVLGALTAVALALPVPVGASGSRPRATCTDLTALSSWPVAAVARLTVVVPVEATSISVAQVFAEDGYGGILLFGSSGPKNLHGYLRLLRSEVPDHAGLLVMTDDEGGGVWRVSNLLAPIPWARQLSADTPAQITSIAEGAARSMRSLGITMDLAPVLDIDGADVEPSATDADGYRSFSGHEAVVARDGVAFMRGLIEGGVTPVVKHFPGLGGVSPNTDDGPASTKPWSVVEQTSLKPFEAAIAAGAPALMVSNATIPGLSSGPATLSPAVYRVLRGQLGFKGLLMTDSLSAGAVSAVHVSIATAGEEAIAAGSDVVLFGLPTSGSTATLAGQIVHHIVAAEGLGLISRAQLDAAGAQVLEAQGADVCPGA